eukprot:gene17087-biopygen1680
MDSGGGASFCDFSLHLVLTEVVAAAAAAPAAPATPAVRDAAAALRQRITDRPMPHVVLSEVVAAATPPAAAGL